MARKRSKKQVSSVYQLKVTLRNAKPPIWRRVLVPSSMNLGDLHEVLQIVMGWSDCHLHQFIAGSITFGMLDDEFADDFVTEDETEHVLSEVLVKEKDSLTYEYDFGDGWEHKIVLEKILPFDGSIHVPSCIKGKRACPPEDCGGVWGYENLIEIIQEPSHPEHEDMLEWVGAEFDPEHFDIEQINAILLESWAP